MSRKRHLFNAADVHESYGGVRENVYAVRHTMEAGYSVEETEKYQSITSFFMNIFLPHGYPDSVSPDYLWYQKYDSIQAFASSITGSVCTHSIMKGVGVGDASATALAATFTWLYKDGVSMVGKIAFAWLQGTSLDIDCKKWRLFADILNDVSMFLDLLSPYFPNYFTVIVCASGVMKAIVGVAGGCTRAALTQHQAIKNNLADVSAKDGSQETLVNLLALLCSLMILPIVTKSVMLTWLLYFLMTAIHLYANYYAVKSVFMNNFNDSRFKIFSRNTRLSVAEVNFQENVFFDFSRDKVKIKLGASFEKFVCSRSYREIGQAFKLYKGANYLIRILLETPSTATIYIILNKRSKAVDIMEAYLQAFYIKEKLGTHSFDILEGKYMEGLEKRSRDYIVGYLPFFLKSVERAGFKKEPVLFKSDLWRADWHLKYIS